MATTIGADGRIGDKFLHSVPGYGGSCFPKDVAALIRTTREARSPLSLIEQVQTVKSERKMSMAGRIERATGVPIAGLLGLDTDDVREGAEPNAQAWMLLLAIAALSLPPPAFRPITIFPHDLEHAAIYFPARSMFGFGYPNRFLSSLVALSAYTFQWRAILWSTLSR